MFYISKESQTLRNDVNVSRYSNCINYFLIDITSKKCYNLYNHEEILYEPPG